VARQAHTAQLAAGVASVALPRLGFFSVRQEGTNDGCRRRVQCRLDANFGSSLVSVQALGGWMQNFTKWWEGLNVKFSSTVGYP
jgi:hypothetical protein